MKVLGRRDRIDAIPAGVLLVAHDEPELLRRTLLRDLDCPYPLLVDRDGASYRLWGMGRGSVARIWLDPRVWVGYARLIVGGERPRALGRDTLQLGGDFVGGPDGTIVYARPQERDDRPPVAVLLRELEAAARGAPGA